MKDTDKANLIFRMEKIRHRLESLNEDFNQTYEDFRIMLRELD
tara:strand:+ start:241 stop:369 length:129 start_codon:yes stop_codon:yes gene_type:complete